jgi:hypothetical protein
MLWKQLVVDFGHELVTSIHMPLVWSNERPNPEEYTAAFHRVSLSSSKVRRRCCSACMHAASQQMPAARQR